MIWITLYNKTRKILQIDKRKKNTHTKYEGCLFNFFFLILRCYARCLSKGFGYHFGACLLWNPVRNLILERVEIHLQAANLKGCLDFMQLQFSITTGIFHIIYVRTYMQCVYDCFPFLLSITWRQWVSIVI